MVDALGVGLASQTIDVQEDCYCPLMCSCVFWQLYKGGKQEISVIVVEFQVSMH